MTTTTTTTTPRARVVCLGDLVGIWCDAETADTLTLEDVHGGADRVRSSCEEIWVMDHEGLPVDGEMSPRDAAEWARAHLEIPEHLQGAFRAWVRTGDCVSECTDALPSTSVLEEACWGTWGSLRDCAEHLAEEIGLIPDDAPEQLARCFDWEAWTRDLAHDCTVVRADWISDYVRGPRLARPCRGDYERWYVSSVIVECTPNCVSAASRGSTRAIDIGHSRGYVADPLFESLLQGGK